MKNKQPYLLLFKGTINSYSTVFFSDNWVLAFILMGVTFFNFYAGLSGLIAVLATNIIAYFMGYNEFSISKGLYGFNSLLVGLGIGITFEPNTAFYILLLFSVILTLFLTISMEGVIGKYALPYLSVPFLFAIWLLFLATRQFHELKISEHGIYILNELYDAGGIALVNKYHQINDLPIPDSLFIYFKSLGAIFFQYNAIAGMLIAIGILIYSRIGFTLSLLGFYAAFFFYQIIGANINDLSYNYIGFNFILTSIAIGGYFIVPSKSSYFWVVVLIPLIVIVTIATSSIFAVYQLSIYSLPFNIIVLMFLYILKFRTKGTLRIEEVISQRNSPELNLYSQLNTSKRFKNTYFFPISLPFWGKWSVSQAHEGEHTHKGEWKHAWDFILKDEQNRAFSGFGMRREEHYCYNKPVLAPADGLIEEVVYHIEDNDIGDVNVNDNWGNTIVIKHAQYLYSKLSHLKTDSIKFKKGDYVRKGEIIAYVGNSGRSPSPHLHFQLQATPFIGSTTIDFPISYYILNKNFSFEMKQFDRPEKDDLVSNIDLNILLSKAFYFIPGKKMSLFVKNYQNQIEDELKWEVFTDYYNNSYIYCHNTQSKAYFYNDGNIHYFKNFEGDKKSILFYFYMAAYKVMLGFYKNIVVKDLYPVYLLNNKAIMFLQDFIAPFYMFIKSEYTLKYNYIDDPMSSNHIVLKSKAETKISNITRKSIDFEMEFKNDSLYKLTIIKNGKTIEARCIN